MKTNIAGYSISIEPEAPNLLTEGGGGSGVDGVTFTPHVTQTTGGTGYIISWTNDGGLPNPAPVTILNGVDGINGLDGTNGTNGTNGATFTPHISAIDGGYRLSWTNDGEEIDPLPVDILNGTDGADGTDGVNGVTFTPHIEEVSGGYQLSWTNDGGQQNPQTILIRTETEVTPFILEGSDSVTITGYSDTSIPASDKYFATKEIPLTSLNSALSAQTDARGTYKITFFLTRSGRVKNADSAFWGSYGGSILPTIKLCRGDNRDIIGVIDSISYGRGVAGYASGGFSFDSNDFEYGVSSTKTKVEPTVFPTPNPITRILKITGAFSSTTDDLTVVLTNILKNSDNSTYDLSVNYLIEKVSDAV